MKLCLYHQHGFGRSVFRVRAPVTASQIKPRVIVTLQLIIRTDELRSPDESGAIPSSAVAAITMSTSTPSSPNSHMHVLLQSFSMIIFSEIGDKTFLIAAILAMRHARGIVFAGAFASLVLMSLLSAALGHLLPALLPKRYTHLAAAALFFVFGARMLLEGRRMRGGSEKIQEEMREAEEEIEGDDAGPNAGVPLEEIEEGGRTRARSGSPSSGEKSSTRRTLAEGARNFCAFFLGPVFVQAFILTFLGEWGDRSQIATIALGAAHNVYLVTLGTVVGHSCCTALAVIGGRYVSTKISVKHVTLSGAFLFLLFGVIYLYEACVMSVSAGVDVELDLDLVAD